MPSESHRIETLLFKGAHELETKMKLKQRMNVETKRQERRKLKKNDSEIPTENYLLKKSRILSIAAISSCFAAAVKSQREHAAVGDAASRSDSALSSRTLVAVARNRT